MVEHLHGKQNEGPKTLFATHYHELTRLAENLPRLKNYAVTVKEWNDEIIFVRQVKPGASERSFGIQVARLAGLPGGVVERAKQILANLEEKDSSSSPPETKKQSLALDDSPPRPSSPVQSKPLPKRISPRVDPSQLELF